MKLTPWFSGDQKPVRPGVYERDYGTRNPWFCHWDGSRWGMSGETSDKAVAWRHWASVNQCIRWRGILRNGK